MWSTTHQKNPNEGFRQQLQAAYIANRGMILQAVYRIIRSMEAAEDVLQTVYLRLIQKTEVESAFCRSPKAYLYRAAINEAVNVYNARKRKKLKEQDIETLEIPAPEVDEDIQGLRDAIVTAKPHVADILNLYYYDGFTCLEISKIRGKPLGTVFSELFRARAEVKKVLLSQEKQSETKKEKHEGDRRTVITETVEGTGGGDQ